MSSVPRRAPDAGTVEFPPALAAELTGLHPDLAAIAGIDDLWIGDDLRRRLREPALSVSRRMR